MRYSTMEFEALSYDMQKHGLSPREMLERDMERLLGDNPPKLGIFRDHRCWKCNDGEKPCAQGGSHRCEYPRARND